MSVCLSKRAETGNEKTKNVWVWIKIIDHYAVPGLLIIHVQSANVLLSLTGVKYCTCKQRNLHFSLFSSSFVSRCQTVSIIGLTHWTLCTFLRAKAGTVVARLSRRNSVCPSVCQTV